MARAAGNADGPGLQKADRVYTASFNSFAARKATFLLALILIGSPVAGLRPMRAGRLRTCMMPRSGMRILEPFFRAAVMSPTKSVSIATAWRFGRLCALPIHSARCFSVTIGGIGPRAGFFAGAAFAAAFFAAPFLAGAFFAFAGAFFDFAAAMGSPCWFECKRESCGLAQCKRDA